MSLVFTEFIGVMKSPTELPNIDHWLVDYCKDIFIDR